MARWKTIESAPIGRSILVDGGTLIFEINEDEEVTEPVKVRYDGRTFYVVETDAYSVSVHNPIYWTDMPTRALDLELPRPVEFDL